MEEHRKCADLIFWIKDSY